MSGAPQKVQVFGLGSPTGSEPAGPPAGPTPASGARATTHAAERAWGQHGQPVVDQLTQQIHALEGSDSARALDRLTTDRLDRRIIHLRHTLEPQLARPRPDLSIER